jgi:eukaryotic-like serine/threonine-protein kinase
MTRQVIERDKLGALTKIGQGGQGVVYGAPNVKTKFAASMVYKEYKSQVLADIDFTALAAMPALVEDSLSYAEAEQLISIAAWPCALVEEAGTPKGFVMPAIPDEFFIDLTTVKGVSKTAAEFQHLLNHSSVLVARGIAIDDAQRYSLLREVASGLASLHKHGVCVGDISPKNLLFSLTPHPAGYFIDCDAMRINGVSVLRQVETPGWQVPAGEELATIFSDAYKLGLLALRLLAGDHDITNLQHIPATAPDMLRQIVSDTLTNPPQQRPLPEAWTYVLGHAIEYAQHQQKTAAPAPVSVAPDAPSTPVVHSRPSSRPSAPPPTPAWSAPPPAQSAPPPPAQWARPASAPSSSKTPVLLIGVGVAILALIAIVVSVVALTSRNNSTPSNNAAPSSGPAASSSDAAAYPSDSYSSPNAPLPPAPTTPTVSIPPPGLYRDQGPGGTSCPDGLQLPGRSGWPTNAGRGAETTSCQFAYNVGVAYWNTGSLPSRDTRQVIAPGTVSCPNVASNCSGNDFIMTCTVNGNDTWITCTGGNDAVVYLW